MNAILTSKYPLASYKACLPNNSENDRCDQYTPQTSSKCNSTHDQENEQLYLSIGQSLSDTTEVNDQVRKGQKSDQASTPNTVHVMEELLMGLMDHLHYTASLHLPSITWDNHSSISTICASRLSRIINQLGMIPSAAPLTSSLHDNDEQHSDMEAFQQLMSSMVQINQWLYSEAIEMQKGLETKAMSDKALLLATISNNLAQTMSNMKTDYSSFRSSSIELRQQVDHSQRSHHLIRCPNTCYTDHTVSCKDLDRVANISQLQVRSECSTTKEVKRTHFSQICLTPIE
jgi:flagellar basal body rod protein FlgC